MKMNNGDLIIINWRNNYNKNMKQKLLCYHKKQKDCLFSLMREVLKWKLIEGKLLFWKKN